MKSKFELKQSADTIELYYYGYIEGDHYDYWRDEEIKSETSARHLREELSKYPDVEFINLYINSSGGSVTEAMGIRSQLKRHPAKVTGYVDGFACSAASFILTGCDDVVMYSNTMQMVHDMWMYTTGNYRELRKTADDLEQISIGNRMAYVEKSNGKLTIEQATELLVNETWLTAEKCLEYGLADEIVDETKDLTEAKQMMQRVNRSLEQQINYNQVLVAQLRDLTLEQKKPPKEPPVEPDPSPEPKENTTIKFLEALMR